jgi:hypothetical protein
MGQKNRFSGCFEVFFELLDVFHGLAKKQVAKMRNFSG